MQMLALHVAIHMLIVDPTPAVANHVVVGGFDRRDDIGVTREGHRHPEHRQRQPASAELLMDAPEPGAAAVLIQRVHRHVPVRVAGGADYIGEKLLGTGVAMQNMVFRPLFIIEDKLHGNARLVRPLRVRRLTGVSSQVARVILCC